MAQSLMDILKQNMQAPAAGQPGTVGTANAPQATDINQTAQIQALVNAKSGKATAPESAPALSNIGEQQANRQTALASQQGQQQGILQATQLGQQATAQNADIEQKEAQTTEQALSTQDQYNNNHAAILNQYQQGQKQLNLDKDKATFEQIGFNIRLQNSQYVDNLNMEAAKNRLDNEANFQDALNRSVFAQESDLFNNDLGFRSMLNADQRTFTDDLSNISLDWAVQMANTQNTQANQALMWKGVGSAVSGAAQAYSASGPADTYARPLPSDSTGSNTMDAEQQGTLDTGGSFDTFGNA